MTEQTPEEQFNPSDHTVDEVNAYLTETDDPAETQRVLDAEQTDKARVGVLEGPHAAQQDTGEGEAADADEGRQQTLTQTQEQGYLGDVPERDAEDPNAPQVAAEAAPADTDGDGFDGTLPDDRGDAVNYATVTDAGDAQDLDQHPDGYVGTLPNEGDREDLTLAGVIARGV